MKSRPRAAEESLETLIQEWGKKKFRPVYLFAGTDSFQKEDALAFFRKNFLPGDDSGLNIDRFDGTAASAGEILNAAGTLPFLGGNRLILVRRANELAKEDMGQVADRITAIAPGNSLVLLWDEKADAGNPLVKAAVSSGAVLTFWVPFENQLPRWIQQRAQAFGKTMSLDTAKLCLESVGPNPGDLNQEIEKLALYVKDRSAIQAEDVETLRPESRTLHFFEWDRALWRRDRAKSMDILEMLRSQGQRPEALLNQIVRVYRRLFLGKAMLSEKKVPVDTLHKIMKIGSFETRREFERAMEEFSWKDLMDALEKILRAERDLKTGRMHEEAGLSLLVCGLTEER